MSFDTLIKVETYKCSVCGHGYDKYQDQCGICSYYDMVRNQKLVTEPEDDFIKQDPAEFTGDGKLKELIDKC